MKPRVLIVDDSLTVRMDLDESMAGAGFETTLCATAAEARAEAARGGFALAILDVLLPDGDGVELLAELKRTSDAPIILLSTEAEVRDRVRGLTTGANEYVGKPYDRSYIVARARELVRSSGVAMTNEAGRVTILLIDDSATFRNALGERLEAEGYAVVAAANGFDGLRLAADVRPGAIIVDGVMPDLDGATVVRRVRLDAVLRRTPCILLTASLDRAAELRALDSGADAFIRKEEDTEIILARLAAVLRSAPTAAFDAPPSVLGPKKILAVDDSPTYLHELASQLGHEGYDMVLARSGEEALELLAVQEVDCILLDVVMPGLSGQETCKRIKASPALRDVPLMMLTAREDRAAMLEGMNAGADDYIPKSSDFEVLRARLRAQLRRKQFEDENRRIHDQLLRTELEASEARAARELAETRANLLADLEGKNRELAAATTELEAFSYSVSHDLRAPLRAIDGFARALLEDHADALGDDGRRIAGIVCKNAEKMSRPIDDLLEFSRTTRTVPTVARVDMTALAREVAAELAEPGREVALRIDELPAAHADAGLVRQVWANLLSNALKYSRKRDVARVDVTGETRDDVVVYTVRDNGVGFDPRYREKLFRVFQRLHSDAEFAGTGVGLALAARIVSRHGGWMTADATLGEGATFSFALPKKGKE